MPTETIILSPKFWHMSLKDAAMVAVAMVIVTLMASCWSPIIILPAIVPPFSLSFVRFIKISSLS